MPLPLHAVAEILNTLEGVSIEPVRTALDTAIAEAIDGKHGNLSADLIPAERMTFRGIILSRLIQDFIKTSTAGKQVAASNFIRAAQRHL